MPAAALEINEITNLYADLAYADEGLEDEHRLSALRELESAVKNFRVAINPA